MGLHEDKDGDGTADRVAPLKAPGEPLRYRRDVKRADRSGIDAEVEHVREHLAMVADYDDDPTTHADAVRVRVVDHVDGDPSLVSVLGELDAEPDAPYLREDYDPLAEFDTPGAFEFRRYSEESRE